MALISRVNKTSEQQRETGNQTISESFKACTPDKYYTEARL